MYGARIRPSSHVSLNNSVIRPSLKKSEGQIFDQVAKDVKSVFTFSRWHLEAELKCKMAEFVDLLDTFNFSSETRGHFSKLM